MLNVPKSVWRCLLILTHLWHMYLCCSKNRVALYLAFIAIVELLIKSITIDTTFFLHDVFNHANPLKGTQHKRVQCKSYLVADALSIFAGYTYSNCFCRRSQIWLLACCAYVQCWTSFSSEPLVTIKSRNEQLHSASEQLYFFQ